MTELLLIAIGSALVSNVVLSQFLGLCPFLGVSKKVETAAGMSGAVIFVITLASAVTGVIYKFVLVRFNITYLQTIVFILVIAALVQFVEMFLKKFMVSLYDSLGVYLPLITTNCAVLGVAINNVKYDYDILTGIVNGFATAVGFAIAIIILAGIREKMEYNDVPEAFKGMPIVLITAGLMAIAFCGFSGLL
ncbi:MAG: RnfABCDGE type electron transport complex subunit A [Lachnospiraceae bacterium]|nr:RnfABCDGE type electron transport complex subunit A [Lachnospiraceae bacterium]MCI7595471.1 RnfABCDGE type electron transport complex subunit A [Lachnospiraceae bacterium]MDD7051506.1 RnfABCDGE type electron transport complex subunit A [Lachnospiraceae bacterium]MDY3223377.1 RnfABCDGE type electron transport complex subunit A [Lachnospiraceae bacterium]MDY4097966.1 RnfABCDGE type electron transport complex subunit A [Lachnospiraceae bacterium]